MAAFNASARAWHHLLYDRRPTCQVTDLQLLLHGRGGRGQLFKTRRLHQGLGHCGQIA